MKTIDILASRNIDFERIHAYVNDGFIKHINDTFDSTYLATLQVKVHNYIEIRCDDDDVHTLAEHIAKTIKSPITYVTDSVEYSVNQK